MPSAEGRQICGLDTSLNLGSQSYKWPMLDVKWAIVGQLPGLSFQGFKEAAEKAWMMWMKVCGIRLQFVDNPQQANILMGIQTIGPGGVLADSELPGPGTTQRSQLKQRYDTQEAWVISENPPQNKIDLVRVIAHEGAHALGVGHIANGNLLAPYYSSKIGVPQSGDIMEMVIRYGTPQSNPNPIPVPSGPSPGADSEGYEELGKLLRKGSQIFVRGKGGIIEL